MLFKSQSADLCYIVNGQSIYKSDIRAAKRRLQDRQLARKRTNWGTVRKPCFIWTFHNSTTFYGGWWLYVRTLEKRYRICSDHRGPFGQPKALDIMSIYPLGFLPMDENLNAWMAKFAEVYHYPTEKRPERQGMAKAWAILNARTGALMKVEPHVRRRDDD